MKLDYFTLISPYPMALNIGNIKSPTLRDVYNISYSTYRSYLNNISITSEIYYKTIESDKYDWYMALESDKRPNIFDIIVSNDNISAMISRSLGFFFVENVVFDQDYKVFVVYGENKDENGNTIPIGVIGRNNYEEVCDIILQLNGIAKAIEEQKPKFKNKLAEKIYYKTQSLREKNANQTDKNIEIGNIISAVCAFHNSINYTNVWDLTVFQLYDQFHRLQINAWYEVRSMSVAAWGDSENTFDASQWYKNLNEN